MSPPALDGAHTQARFPVIVVHEGIRELDEQFILLGGTFDALGEHKMSFHV